MANRKKKANRSPNQRSPKPASHLCATLELVIELYWRPGCGFCRGLERGLGKHEGLSISRHNIWDDPKAAAFVREHSNGNEIVPTVRVGETVLVNPTTNQVLAAVAKEMPEVGT